MADTGTVERADSPGRRRLTFLDLPEETQKEIFCHCGTPELICLSLVSHRFRELAAEQLYHTVHLVFPYDFDMRMSDGRDDLTGALETFTTSDYNYARHLCELEFDTSSAGTMGENAYKGYKHDSSAGKLLNTLLLLTLRRAYHLETFTWNARIELSRQLYKALHQIPTLVNVEIRLQSGPSQYESPPPLPLGPAHSTSSVTSSPPSIISHNMGALAYPVAGFNHMSPPPPVGLFANPPASSLFYAAAQASGSPLLPMPLPTPSPKPPTRSKAPKHPLSTREPPTISGFKNLKSLGILDIDSLDILTEIKACIRNSSGTLTQLSLSFSDALASKARKPPPLDLDTEDSDIDDEFQPHPVALPPMSISGDDPSSSKAMSAQEERQSQESALGRIFDIEPFLINKPIGKTNDAADKQSTSDGDDDDETNGFASGKPKSTEDGFIHAVRTMTERLISGANSSTGSIAQHQETLEMVEKAARQYVLSADARTKKSGENGEASGEAVEATASGSGSNSAQLLPNKEEGTHDASLFHANMATTAKTKAKENHDISPEDIDIEEPEGQLILDPQDGSSDKDGNSPAVNDEDSADERETVAGAAYSEKSTGYAKLASSKKLQRLELSETSSKAMAKLVANLAAQKMNYEVLLDKLHSFEALATQMAEKIKNLRQAEGDVDLDRVADTERQMRSFRKSVDELYKELRIVEGEVEDAKRQIKPALAAEMAAKEATTTTATGSEHNRQLVNEYVRSTRGLALEDFAAHQIPVKASVLSKAIDLRVLQRIALLNVGSQAPIWTLLAKENKMQPLPLQTIFTDNVTVIFLKFVGELNKVTNLLLMERDPKNKVQSFATRTTTTIDQIRRLALRKHAPHLQRLVIQNAASQDWDLDETTVKLLARRATKLEELGVTMNMKSIHVFLQQLPGFVSLMALHIIRLRNDDTCIWVMHETRRFILDTLSHYPHLKLEWLSVAGGTMAQRIVRVDNSEDDKKKKAGKDKGKEVAVEKTDKAKGKEKAVVFGDGDAANSCASTGNPSAAYTMGLVNGWASANIGSVSGVLGLGGEDEDDDYSDESDSEIVKPLRFKLEEYRFSDIWEVQIFQKEIVKGRL